MYCLSPRAISIQLGGELLLLYPQGEQRWHTATPATHHHSLPCSNTHLCRLEASSPTHALTPRSWCRPPGVVSTESSILFSVSFTLWWGDKMFTCIHRNFQIFTVFSFFPVFHNKRIIIITALLKSQIFRNVTQRSHFQFMHFNKCYYGFWEDFIGPGVTTIALLRKDLQVKKMQITKIDAVLLTTAAVFFYISALSLLENLRLFWKMQGTLLTWNPCFPFVQLSLSSSCWEQQTLNSQHTKTIFFYFILSFLISALCTREQVDRMSSGGFRSNHVERQPV